MKRLVSFLAALLFCGHALAGYSGNGPFQNVPTATETNGATVWNSSTIANTTAPLVTPQCNGNTCLSSGPQSVRISLNVAGTITAGQIGVQVSADNVNWCLVGAASCLGSWALTSDQSGGYAPATNPVVLASSTNSVVKLWMGGYQAARLILNPKLGNSDTGTVTLYSTLGPSDAGLPFVLNNVGSLVIAGQGAAGSPSGGILSVQGVTSGTPVAVSLSGAVSGGCLPFHGASGGTSASNNATLVKNSAGEWCVLSPINTSTSIGYLKLYDSSSSPTCSSATNLKHVYPVPPAQASGQAGGFTLPMPSGEQYSNGLAYCVVGGGLDTDNSNAPTGIFIEGSRF